MSIQCIQILYIYIYIYIYKRTLYIYREREGEREREREREGEGGIERSDKIWKKWMEKWMNQNTNNKFKLIFRPYLIKDYKITTILMTSLI